jgi:hypothetical protein
MIKKKVKLGRQEKSYKLVAFTLNVFESVKLVKMEERRRIPSYAQAQRV